MAGKPSGIMVMAIPKLFRVPAASSVVTVLPLLQARLPQCTTLRVSLACTKEITGRPSPPRIMSRWGALLLAGVVIPVTFTDVADVQVALAHRVTRTWSVVLFRW